MFKNISYNKLKHIRFIAGIILFIFYALSVLLSYHVLQNISEAINLVVVFVLLAHFCVLSLYHFITIKKDIEDEMSKNNDKTATWFTFAITNVVITTFLVLIVVFEISLKISFTYWFCAYVLLHVFNDGYYLFLEKRDIKNAGTDDED